MMRQYLEIKKNYKDTLVLYRLGDFYELFFEDAKKAAKLLDLTLTRRGTNNGEPIPMAGVPFHAVDNYIAKLIKLGESCVICEQVGKPGEQRTMQRKVSKIITPGTTTDEGIAPEGQDNLTACIFKGKRYYGYAYISLGSGTFKTTICADLKEVMLYLDKTEPTELVYPENFKEISQLNFSRSTKALAPWNFEIENAYRLLCTQFETASLFGFDIEVSGLTTISSNLKISSSKRGRNIIRQLHPDGCCTVTYSQSDFKKKWKVFIEIERNRNNKFELLDKLEKYKIFIPAAQQFYEGYDDIVVMFFFDDTEEGNGSVEEKRRTLLETMKKYGIRGCFGLLSDARKPIDGWNPKHAGIEKETCGNMYLYRKMWQVSDYWPDSVKLAFPFFLL